MTTDEILYVWQFFDERMSQKFLDGLTMSDIYGFTPAEWEAAFVGMAPTDFKRIFFDRMDVKGINYTTQFLGDMDDFLEGLTVEDWKNMTGAEWEAFLMSTDIAELVEFIHEMHQVDRKIVYDMFKFMPHEMLEDFREAPELSHEFSKSELETIGHAVDQNVSKKDSFMDEEFERLDKNMRRHKDRRGGNHGKGHGPKDQSHHKNKKGGKKNHQKKQEFMDSKPKNDAFFDNAMAWFMDNEDFKDFGFDALDQLKN